MHVEDSNVTCISLVSRSWAVGIKGRLEPAIIRYHGCVEMGAVTGQSPSVNVDHSFALPVTVCYATNGFGSLFSEQQETGNNNSTK